VTRTHLAAACRRSFVTLALVALATAPSACGGAQTGVGTSHAARAPEPLALMLRTTEGDPIDVATLRGKPVVLFFFATFDTLSQAATRPLARFARQHADDVRVVGVAVQPDAATLAGAWASALDVPFDVAYEPEPRVLAGLTQVGELAGVPTFIVLDREGRIVARHTGFASENKLGRLLEPASAR
jgi:peroxiredoxin